MSDLHNRHDRFPVVHFVDDAITALADPEALPCAQFLAAPRPRLVSQRSDARGDPSSVLLRGDILELFDGRGLDEDAIGGHAA